MSQFLALIQKYKEKITISDLLLFISLFSITILGFILTSDIETYVDIGLWDETKYLGNGLFLLESKPEPFWGPVYSLWYFVLNLCIKNTIDLYYINFRLMTIIPSIVLFIFMKQLTKNVIISFFFSYLLLISPLNLIAWPKISHFTIILILLTLIFIFRIKNNNSKLFISCIAALILTYVRPEYIFVFLILFAILLILFFRKRISLLKFSVLLLFTLMSIIFWGNPYSSGRSLTAFGQAYDKYINLSERIDENARPKEWSEVLQENFPNANNLFDITLNYTDKFLNHINHNLERLPNIFLRYDEFIIPTKLVKIDNMLTSILLLILFCMIPIKLISLLQKKNNPFHKDLLNDLSFIITISFLFTAPVVLSIILFLPRLHYLLLMLPLFYSLISIIFVSFKLNNKAYEIIGLLLFIILGFTFLPNLSMYFEKSELKNRRTIEEIRSLELNQKIILLENNGGFSYYLGNNFHWLKIYPKNQPFDKFILDKKVDIILDQHELSFSKNLKNDSSWYKFLDDPTNYGFKELLLNTGKSIYFSTKFLSK